MDPRVKKSLQAMFISLLYIILFLLLMPALLKVMDQTWGKLLYALLALGAVAVAFRLRALSKHWQ